MFTVDVTPPAEADAVTGPKPDPTLRKIGKFTASRVDGGLIATRTGWNGADANACWANWAGFTAGAPAGPCQTVLT
jgi:hypothetical protein